MSEQTSLILSRRSLVTGLASLLAAPAIVRASSLMPIRNNLTVECWGAGEASVAYSIPTDFYGNEEMQARIACIGA